MSAASPNAAGGDGAGGEVHAADQLPGPADAGAAGPAQGGLPNGIQLVGRPYAEAQLFAIGQAYQREVPPEVARPVK